jgi:Flp pilus assembly protein TadG
MFGSVGKFAKDRKGAFAMQFALMVIPLTVCTGLSIDGGRAFLARYELAAACDAAALALASTVEDDVDINVLAHKFVNANFHGEHNGPIVLDVEDLGDEEETIILRGEATIDTYFMPIVGQPTVTVTAECEVKRGGNNVEVTLALDVTESMGSDADPSSRISTLREAATDLIDTVVSDLQTPFYSRIAIVPWANNVYVGDYADTLRGPVTPQATITAATWKKEAAVSSVSATWRTGSQFTVSTVSKVSGRVRITVTGTPTALVNGDTVGLYLPSSGSANGSFASYRDKAYRLANRSGTSTVTFDLQDTSGAYVAPPAGSTNGTSWRVQECLNSLCQMRLSSSGSNNLTGDDWVHLTGFGSPYSTLNNAAGSPWQVASSPSAPTSSTAFLTVVGPTIGSPNYTTTAATGGTIQECFTDTCEVKITAASHGLSANGEHVEISSMPSAWGTLNYATTPSWPIESLSGNDFILTGSVGPNYTTAYSSTAGRAQCLTQGCAKYRFTNASGSTSIRSISECVSERVGANQYTDAPPSTTFVGRDYAGTGAYVRCETANQILPLTSDKDVLKAFIDKDTGMQLTGATAGQMGAAWGWYMISPDWGYLWPNAENQPGPWDQSDLKKVVVLMTDGEFNTAHCNGVVSGNYGISNSSDRGDCNATNGSPFTQAENLCGGMRAQGVIVYTVGFEVTAGGGADNFLEACATDSDHYYLADNGEELKDAFDQIATSISMLRIAR